jgi:hypothetical protein
MGSVNGRSPASNFVQLPALQRRKRRLGDRSGGRPLWR